MTKSTDERGRVTIPLSMREDYGDEFHIVEFPNHIGLVPVDKELPPELEKAVEKARKKKENRIERWRANGKANDGPETPPAIKGSPPVDD